MVLAKGTGGSVNPDGCVGLSLEERGNNLVNGEGGKCKVSINSTIYEEARFENRNTINPSQPVCHHMGDPRVHAPDSFSS